MDDNQNEWDDEDPECRRFRVRETIWWVSSYINKPCFTKPSIVNQFYVYYWYWCCDDCRVLQFEEQAMLDLSDHTDQRKWTQQHLDAADLRIASIAPTPPQGEIENDCMDVNVRGPGVYTYHEIIWIIIVMKMKTPIHFANFCKQWDCTQLQTQCNPLFSPLRWFHSPDDRLLQRGRTGDW